MCWWKRLLWWRKSSKNSEEVTPLPKELSEEIYIELVKTLSKLRERILVFGGISPYNDTITWIELNDKKYVKFIPEVYDELKEFFKHSLPRYDHFAKHEEGYMIFDNLKNFLNKKIGVKFDKDGRVAITKYGEVVRQEEYSSIVYSFMRGELDLANKKNLCKLRKCDDKDAEKFFNETRNELMKDEKFKKAFDKRDSILKEIDGLSDKLVKLHKKNLEYPEKASRELRESNKKLVYATIALVTVTLVIGSLEFAILVRQTQFEEYQLMPKISSVFGDECPQRIDIVSPQTSSNRRTWNYPMLSHLGGSLASCYWSIESDLINLDEQKAVFSISGESSVKPYIRYTLPIESDGLKNTVSVSIDVTCIWSLHNRVVYERQFYCEYELDEKFNEYTLIPDE